MTYGKRVEEMLDLITPMGLTREDFIRLALACLDQADVAPGILAEAVRISNLWHNGDDDSTLEILESFE